jgi:hypothetical protein
LGDLIRTVMVPSRPTSPLPPTARPRRSPRVPADPPERASGALSLLRDPAAGKASPPAHIACELLVSRITALMRGVFALTVAESGVVWPAVERMGSIAGPQDPEVGWLCSWARTHPGSTTRAG